jgi:hypothetical protein
MSQTITNQVHLLVYTSQYSGTPDTIDADLKDIVSKAQRNNPGSRITGVLFYHGGRFLQFIEGPEDSTRELLSRISRDTRHGEVEILFDEQISERGFEQWAMDTFNLTTQEVLGLELLQMIRDAYRRNFVTYTDKLVGIYKGFVEQHCQI